MTTYKLCSGLEACMFYLILAPGTKQSWKITLLVNSVGKLIIETTELLVSYFNIVRCETLVTSYCGPPSQQIADSGVYLDMGLAHVHFLIGCKVLHVSLEHRSKLQKKLGISNCLCRILLLCLIWIYLAEASRVQTWFCFQLFCLPISQIY